jgi:tetratricopeptide (TPR) repeat protein|tara:strand:+ start:75 stop:458 length:384 start_codon:yes stop_codon:yes gene_type:complete
MNKLFQFNEFIELGNIFMDCEAYLIALEHFNKAISLSYLPVNKDRLIKAYDLRGKTKRFLGMYIESIIDYSKAIELDPKDSYLYFFRGMSYDYLNLNEEALKNMKISVELDPCNELAVDMVNYLEKK